MRTLITLAIVAVLATACSKSNPEAEAALAEKKAHEARHARVDSVAKAWMAAVTPEAAKALYADDAMMYNPDYPQGRKAADALVEMAERMKAFTDWRMESQLTRVGDDFFAVAGSMIAKYSGPSDPSNPKSAVVKDAQISGPWVAIVVVNEAGKVTGEHIQWDNMAMAAQMAAAAKKK